MRNRYRGTCYRCGESVAPGEGHFERHQGGWRTQHASCAIIHRNTRRREQAEQAMTHSSPSTSLSQGEQS
jgi:hypothetical protein